MKPTILCVVGTRPEAIKVAPVVRELRRYDSVQTVLVSTGQHKEILLSALAAFDLAPDVDLAIMRHGQTLAEVTSRALEGLDGLFCTEQPAIVVAQGDTTTTFVSALAAFYRRIPFAHVEAGLRTTTIDDPFPEEFNRRAAGLISRWHFAPTSWSRDNLLAESKEMESVFVTGNTGIDAVQLAVDRPGDAWFADHRGRILLLTTHRRENWGEPQAAIARAALRIVENFPDTLLVVPMHPNPRVRQTLLPILGNHPRIKAIEPPDYLPFVKLMARSSLILSDSGGVQEEAPAFGIPVLVLRATTERPEGVNAGTAKLVGTDEEIIFDEARKLLADNDAYKAMANAVSPYGDGRAAERVRYVLLRDMGIESPEVPMWA